MEAVQGNEFAFAEYLASSEVERMEREEAESLRNARAAGTEIDLTQAKQALERIFRNGAAP